MPDHNNQHTFHHSAILGHASLIERRDDSVSVCIDQIDACLLHVTLQESISSEALLLSSCSC